MLESKVLEKIEELITENLELKKEILELKIKVNEVLILLKK